MEDYTFEEFNEGTERIAGEQVIAKLTEFVIKHGTQLHDIEEELEENLGEVWDTADDPVSLESKSREQTTLVELIKTDNKILNKVVLVFTNNCLEIKLMVEKAKNTFYAPLKMFGTVLGGAATNSEGEAQIEFAKSLPLLGQLSSFITRSYSLIKNIIHQMSALYNNNQRLYVTSFKNVHMESVLEHIGYLLSMFITLDEIIKRNNSWLESLKMYQRMIKSIKSNPSAYNTNDESIWDLEKNLFSLKAQLLDGNIYQNCIESNYEEDILPIASNKEFKKEFWGSVKSIYDRWLARLSVNEDDSMHRSKLIHIISVYIFYIILFKDLSDVKTLKNIFEVHKKVPLVHLYGDTIWFPTEFMINIIPGITKILNKTDVTEFQKAYANKLSNEFVTRTKMLHLQISGWLVKMESNLNHQGDTQQILRNRSVRLMNGLRLAYDAGNLFKETICIHSSKFLPFKASLVPYACQLIELIKAIQFTFARKSTEVAESLTFMVQQGSFNLQKMLINIQSKLEDSKKFNDARLDTLAATNLIIQMLNGCASIERRTIIRISIHLLFQQNILKAEEIELVKTTLSELDLLCEFEDVVKDACDCNFFYWSRAMLPIYLDNIYNKPDQAFKLQYMFSAIRDITPMFKQTVNIDYKLMCDEFKKEVDQEVTRCILSKLCMDIETDLRYHVHSHLQVSDRNVFKSAVKDLSHFFRIKPLRYFDKTIDIKSYVEHYLDTTFYNLTTVALNDWKTYGEMRSRAEEKYSLMLTEVHLPGQTLEQGIDVIEITRNIHVFVAKYNYNLNNQIFVERATEKTKTLNVINISHVSNSIRTHGVGIMNTTVNFIYQYLKQKFVVFSQFLFDDHIKARLYRDARYYKENKSSTDNKYPYDRAHEFNKEIRKLGLTENKQSYLDQFRNLITEIGNAMGYIRMIRSGGFGYISNAIKFVPDLQDIVSLHEMVSKDNLSQESVKSANNLDGAIDCLAKNFAEGAEYFELLVNVFADEFRNEENSHMRNFFIILPPLAINFVDHMLAGKDKLAKKKAGGFFTDDGFAIGVAYILKLLNQYKQYESLHWFEEVNDHYNEEVRKLKALMSKQKKDEQQASSLTQNKLKGLQMEFDLLHFSLSGASVFFKQ